MIDADAVARDAEMGNRINTVMQPCFFQLSGVLPPEEAIERIKASVEKTYGGRGQALVERNFAAIDGSLAGLRRVTVPATCHRRPHDGADRAGRRARLRQAGHARC